MKICHRGHARVNSQRDCYECYRAHPLSHIYRRIDWEIADFAARKGIPAAAKEYGLEISTVKHVAGMVAL